MSATSKRLVCITFAAAAISAMAGPKDDVAKAFGAWDGAFNKGDAKAIGSLYTKDAVFLPPTHEVKTGAEIENFFGGLFANKVTDHKLEPFKIIDAGDKLIVASKWSAKGRDDKGNPSNIGGIATHVLERQADKSYKVKLHTFN